jgi:ribonuclease HI
MVKLKIYVDGASRCNPGHAAWAYVAVKRTKVHYQGSGYIGMDTNNAAEYKAIINALSEVIHLSSNIEVYSDSQLVVNQINGQYKINLPHLAALKQQVDHLRKNFKSISFIKVPRENPYIQEADKLCNECLDNHFNLAETREK